MDYKGSFRLFDNSGIRTYPLASRKNKVAVGGFVDCAALRSMGIVWPSDDLEELAGRIADCHRARCPVIIMSGAHPIKNGLAPIFIDLIERGIVTLYATNGATTIHSFELALTGSSSEDVRGALPKGDFGMAYETGVYLNQAIALGARNGWGYGEAMGRLINDPAFRKEVIDTALRTVKPPGEILTPYDGFPFAETNLFGRAWRKGVPATVHGMIGTDINDQHANFDPAAKGMISGRDFLIYTDQICRMTAGGVVLNIGSAVMGPEVFLKAVSMAANVGCVPDGLYAGNFDIRPFVFDDNVRDEGKYYYYLRDQKSIATRIPRVFNGKGYYFEGDHALTVKALYQYVMKAMGED